MCWGGNDSGQLCIGTTTTVVRNRYVKVDLGDEDVLSFSCGGAHTCAVTTSGALYCWGANNNAALGSIVVLDDCSVSPRNVGCSASPVEGLEFGPER